MFFMIEKCNILKGVYVKGKFNDQFKVIKQV